MYLNFEISEEILKVADEVERDLKDLFNKYEERTLKSSAKILKAFQNNKVSTSDFMEVTGYGYFDAGREKLERIYAEVFGAEDALVRPQIMSGTHALALTFSGILRPGDTMLSISGRPYDTLQGVIGIIGDSELSLMNNGIKYEEIDLVNNDFDYEKIEDRVKKGNLKLVEIQRSRGYAQRKSINIEKIEKVIKLIKSIDKNVIVMVDNCYGEFVEDFEPTMVGADVFVSSLMKNLGSGIATSGGYVVGRKDVIKLVAERLTAPGVGKDMGANFNQWLSYYKGLFFAPRTVESTLKTMAFASGILEKFGFEVSPTSKEKRADIIQTIELKNSDNLIKFCQGLQMGSPIESYVIPVPEETPGYPHPEIMAGGSFTPGATIELSCDGPLIEPYTAYMQGGLTYEYGKLGVMIALQKMLND